jgi:hypothetical protein
MTSESGENSYTLDVPDLATLPSVAFETRKSLPMVGGVYFVYGSLGAVLYVGSSKNLRTRWALHHRSHQFEVTPGTRIAWMVVENSAHRLALERHCIEALHPLAQQATMPLRRDKQGHLLYEVKLRLPESTFMRLSEAAVDYHRTLPNQIIYTLKRLITSGQLYKWGGAPDERSKKGNRKQRRVAASKKLRLFK